jgi:hypothetical protein
MVLIGLLVACSPPERTSSSAREAAALGSCNARLALPQVGPSAKYEHWHLLVSKSGNKRWNGQDIDAVTARKYMVELSKMPADAGKLVVHLEPGTSCEIIEEVSRILNESPLCSEHRCLQDQWDYKKPIVS